MKPTISVIIPALNEEANIAMAVSEAIRSVDGRFFDYELLLFDDGSSDRTGEIMDKLAAENPRIRVTHNSQPRNLGGVCKQGIALARFDYMMMIPGDNENPHGAISPVLNAIGEADLVIPYSSNPQVRPLGRRIGSNAYQMLVNILFGHKLRYYNGTVLARTTDLRSIKITTSSFAYQTEVLLKLLRDGRTYVEIGVEIQGQPGRKSKALRPGNLIAIFKALCHLFIEVHFHSPKQHPTSQ